MADENSTEQEKKVTPPAPAAKPEASKVESPSTPPTDEVEADSSDEDAVEAAPVAEAGQSVLLEVGKYDIRVGDVWSANTDGETVYVVEITEDGNPVIADSTGQHEISAEHLNVGFRHDGPNHGEPGVARV